MKAQAGVVVGHASEATLKGQVWDDADPQFNNYTYRYKVNHTYVALQGKLFADIGYIVTPWVAASLGVSFNKSHNYTNQPVIFEAIPNPNFRSHTKTAFAYALSIGVEKNLNTTWRAGLGYEFANWGKNRLNPAPFQTLNKALNLSHFYTHTLLFNVTYTIL